MVDTLSNINIPSKTWVNVYSSSGITVGVQLRIQNIGKSEVIMTSASTEPSDTTASNKFLPYEFFTNSTGDGGCWAYSVSGTTLNVAEA